MIFQHGVHSVWTELGPFRKDIKMKIAVLHPTKVAHSSKTERSRYRSIRDIRRNLFTSSLVYPICHFTSTHRCQCDIVMLIQRLYNVYVKTTSEKNISACHHVASTLIFGHYDIERFAWSGHWQQCGESTD